MFKPPVITELAPGQIAGLSAAHNNTGNSLKDALGLLRDDAARLNIAYFGAGRFIGSAEETIIGGAGAPRIGEGLGLELPDCTMLIGGYIVAPADLAEYVAGVDPDPGFVPLPDAPPNGVWFAYLELLFDEDLRTYSLSVDWQAAQLAGARAAGKPCVGKVTTDADSITALDLTTADVIWNQALMQQRIAAAGTGGGGEGGGDPATVYSGSNPWLESDTRDTKIVVAEMISTAVAGLQAQIDAGGRLPATSQLGFYAHRQAIISHQTARVYAPYADELEGCIVSKDEYGESSGGTVNHILVNTMVATEEGWAPT